MQKFIIPTSSGELLINTTEVSHFSAKGERFCWLVMNSGKRKLIQVSFEEVFHFLPRPPFCKVHNEHIVHIDSIEKVLPGDNMMLELITGQVIPVSIELIGELLNQ